MVRIFASVGLLVIKPFSPLFFFFYLICGISDVLDGYMARKMAACSKFGQIFDSVADLLFIGVVLVVFIPIINLPLIIIRWILVIAGVRLASVITGLAKYRQLAFLHTYANKATGIILFCFPFLFYAFGAGITAAVICCVASLSAVEELLINLTSKTLDRDIGSIFRT